MTERVGRIRFASRAGRGPLAAIGLRVGIALAIVLVNWLLVVLERGGYTDSHDGHVSVADALYYTTVTLTTTGYGDITPITTTARLVNALVVTPMRLLFVVLLVGTTISALTERSRQEFRLARWRSRVRDHVVVLGYGTKGRNAVRALRERDTPPANIVVVDRDANVGADVTRAGLTSITGPATSEAVLRDALVDRASTVIVALGSDDAAILATLTVRRLNEGCTVVAAAREAENADLLQQGGANSVIVSSETAGRLLGVATESPHPVQVVEDLLSFGQGIDLRERAVTPAEAGRSPHELGVPVLAVVRAGAVLRYNDPGVDPLRPADRIVYAGA